jgi:hypothetical protein
VERKGQTVLSQETLKHFSGNGISLFSSGKKIAPAFSGLPPSMAVVLVQHAG